MQLSRFSQNGHNNGTGHARLNSTVEMKKISTVSDESYTSDPLFKALRTVEATYKAFDAAERELVKIIGVPICMPNCGKCCEVTTPIAWEFEAHFMTSFLGGSGQIALSKIQSICDGWLLERDGLSRFGWKGQLTKDQQAKLNPEIDKLLLASPCPFLDSDKSCMVHFARPLICRAYGVTRMTSRMCNRPLSPMEDQDTRAHIGFRAPLGDKINRLVNRSHRETSKIGWTGAQFLPTAILSVLLPEKVAEYEDNNLVPTAKLVHMGWNPAIIWQEQLNSIWAMEAQAMQVISKEREENHV